MTVALWAQCGNSVTTTYAGGNGCSGNFFDVQASTNVTICSFDVHIGGTTTETVEVYAVIGGGPYAPVATNQAAWALLSSTVVTGSGVGIPTPLNLNLNYLVPAGTIQGFIVRTATSTNFDYTNGTAIGAIAGQNPDLTIFEGQYTCNVGGFPVLTNAVRVWNGTIHYITGNNLSITNSGPGVGDLTISVTDLSTTASEGWLLVSLETSGVFGQGPLLGLTPDATTFNLFFNSPLADGFPLHFPIPSPTGSFPTTPFLLPPGANVFPPGTMVDAVLLLVRPGFVYDGRSNVVRYTF